MNTEKENQIDETPLTEKQVRDEQFDAYILKLRDDLLDSGVMGDALVVAVARIYSNSVLLAYKEHLNNGV